VDEVVVGEEGGEQHLRALVARRGQTGHERRQQREVRQEQHDRDRDGPGNADRAVRAALDVDGRHALGFPEHRHLLDELLEEPRGLALADRLQPTAHGMAVLGDVPGHRVVLVVHLLPRQGGVALEEVQAARGRDRHERVEGDPVPPGPGRHHEHAGQEQRRRPPAAAGTPAPPGEPQRGQRYEVEEGLAREHGQPPQDSGGQRGPDARACVGREQPLEAPPHEHAEERFHPEMRREPDELGVEGGDARGQQPGARAQRLRTHAADRRHQQHRHHHLRPLRHLQAARETERHGQEVGIERRVEDELGAEGMERHARVAHVPRPFHPHLLVGHGRGGGLQHEEGDADREGGQGQDEQRARGGRLRAGGHSRTLARLADFAAAC
jgi:hypothetical protein